MLYLESPVGVGFSYADTQQDYITNDDVSSQDNLKALMTFFNLYPKFRSHKFFIAGESYGGIYVPTLAEAVMWATNNGTWNGTLCSMIFVFYFYFYLFFYFCSLRTFLIRISNNLLIRRASAAGHRRWQRLHWDRNWRLWW